MRLQSMGIPDALNGSGADPLSLGHGTATPMRGPLGFGLQGGLDNLLDLAGWDGGLAAPPGFDLRQSCRSALSKPLAPEQDGWPTDSQLLSYAVIGHSFGRL